MKKIFKRFVEIFKPPFTRKKIIKLIALLVILFVAFNAVTKDTPAPETATEKTPIVFVGTVGDISNGDGATFVGTVRALDEAQILSETSGRVTNVSAQPGDQVFAGTVLASLENASEQAALLQAQGAYEAALAGAAQSEISLGDARNSAISAYRNSYATSYSTLITNVDIFFSNPNSLLIPGVRISAGSKTSFLNETRKAFNASLKEWQSNSATVSQSDDLFAYLSEAQTNIETILSMVDVLITETNEASSGDMLDGIPVNDYVAPLTTARSTLTGLITSLASAAENLKRAEIGATQNSDASLSNAQVKQALGALRTAQAMYEKTVFRSPISGTVNSLSINVGDFVNAFTQVAEVANNDALQISIFVGEADLQYFTVGGEVAIGNTVGIVTSVAPAIDPATQKTEVKIAAESSELINGSTVSVSVDQVKNVESNGPLFLPITAVKFEATDGFVFTVSEGALVSNPVSVGRVQGSSVEILEGVDPETIFVIDARGLSAGQKVEAVRNQ